VKFFFPINLMRILRAVRNERKSYLGKTLWIFVMNCAKRLFEKASDISFALQTTNQFSGSFLQQFPAVLES
jgi:hypothetical protein